MTGPDPDNIPLDWKAFSEGLAKVAQAFAGVTVRQAAEAMEKFAQTKETK